MHCREILFTPRCSTRVREFPFYSFTVLKIAIIKNNTIIWHKKRTINVSVSQGDVHSKFTWQNFNKNILETELLNLSNPEKSVVLAGKLFHMILTIRMLKKLRLLELKHRCLCNIYAWPLAYCSATIPIHHSFIPIHSSSNTTFWRLEN